MVTCVAECEAENYVKVRSIILADSSAKLPVFPAGFSSHSLYRLRPVTGALPWILVIRARKRKQASEVARSWLRQKSGTSALEKHTYHDRDFVFWELSLRNLYAKFQTLKPQGTHFRDKTRSEGGALINAAEMYGGEITVFRKEGTNQHLKSTSKMQLKIWFQNFERSKKSR